MMKNKRLLSLFLALLMVFQLSVVSFAKNKALTIKASSVSCDPGDTVTIKISLNNNTGLSSLKLDVLYDSCLTLKNVKFHGVFSNETAPVPYSNPQTISFISPTKEVKSNDTIATLTFKVSKKVVKGYKALVEIRGFDDDVFDADLNNVQYSCVNGGVRIKREECLHKNTHIVKIKTATEKEPGYTGDVVCDNCGAIVSVGRKIPKIDQKNCKHNYKTLEFVSSCVSDGYQLKVCQNCGYVIIRKYVAAKGHIDKNNNGSCDVCKMKVYKAKNCTCCCHKSGFPKSVWDAFRVFYKIFRQHHFCDCGTVHY